MAVQAGARTGEGVGPPLVPNRITRAAAGGPAKAGKADTKGTAAALPTNARRDRINRL